MYQSDESAVKGQTIRVTCAESVRCSCVLEAQPQIARRQSRTSEGRLSRSEESRFVSCWRRQHDYLCNFVTETDSIV